MEFINSNSQVEMNKNSYQQEKINVAANEKKPPRPQDQAEKCPRCDSGNTKFCYYNNYSLSQPRYFCKACRRYWTKGGTLRNVPVGGGCRKNRRLAKRTFDNHHGHLLLQSHQQLENDHNNSNNVVLNSNFSSPMRYEDSLTCDNLSLAFATLQRQNNVHLENSIFAHQPITNSFKNNYHQGLYNYGFENGGEGQNGHFTQPLLNGNEDQRFRNMVSREFNEMINGDENGNRVLLGLPWQVDNVNNGEVQCVFDENECNNYSYYNNEGCYEMESGERLEKWNNNNNGGLVTSGTSWSNLINSTLVL